MDDLEGEDEEKVEVDELEEYFLDGSKLPPAVHTLFVLGLIMGGIADEFNMESFTQLSFIVEICAMKPTQKTSCIELSHWMSKKDFKNRREYWLALSIEG